MEETQTTGCNQAQNMLDLVDENQIRKYRIRGSCSRSYRPNRAHEWQHLSRNNDTQHPLYNGQFSLYIGNVVLGCQVLGAGMAK